jgi:hypothetical protein
MLHSFAFVLFLAAINLNLLVGQLVPSFIACDFIKRCKAAGLSSEVISVLL